MKKLTRAQEKIIDKLIRSQSYIKYYLLFNGCESMEKWIGPVDKADKSTKSPAQARVYRLSKLMTGSPLPYEKYIGDDIKLFFKPMDRYDRYIVDRTTIGIVYDGEKFTSSDLPIVIPMVFTQKKYQIGNVDNSRPSITVTDTRTSTSKRYNVDDDMISRMHTIVNILKEDQDIPFDDNCIKFIVFGDYDILSKLLHRTIDNSPYIVQY